MKVVHGILAVGTILLLAFLLAHWWFDTAWSESVWTWINHRIDNGRNPGLASDAEFVLTMVLAVLISTGAVLLLSKVARRVRQKIKR